MFRLLALTFLFLVLDERGSASAATTEQRNDNRIGVLKEHSSGSRNAGDLYIGTKKGVYLKYVGTHDVRKIECIDEAVAAINIDFNGGAFVTTSNGKLYYINTYGENEQGVQSYIPGKVLSIGILKQKSSGSRNAGDIYIGTTKGVYLKYVRTHDIKKIEKINEAVIAINIDFNGGAFVTTASGKLYYINTHGENTQGVQCYIPDKVLSIGVLEKASSGERKAGDIYIGTNKGVYLKYVGTHDIKKIEGINEAVTAINIDFNGGAALITLNGKVYYIDNNGDNKQGVQDYIPDKVFSIGCLKENSAGSRKAGDWYIGTSKGVYLKYVGTHNIKKIDGIYEAVVEIDIDFNGGVFVVTKNGNLYYIDPYGENQQGVQSYIPYKIL